MDFAATETTKGSDQARIGRKAVAAGWNNVLFSAHFACEDCLGLHLDPRFNLTGCEDTDFFVRAWKKGASIVASDAGNTIIDLDRNRHLNIALSALRRGFDGAIWMLIALRLDAFSCRRFKEYALQGGRKLIYAPGQIPVLAGYRYEGYRVIDGR